MRPGTHRAYQRAPPLAWGALRAYTVAPVTDDELLDAFETCTLGAFHHHDHVRVTWLYLRRSSVLETLGKLIPGLKRFAESKGRAAHYHETITWAYTLLIHDRMRRLADDHTFEEFERENADLFDWKNSIIRRYYDEATLKSEHARRVFVLPDPAL
jgi:hypothetical protein